MRFVHVYTFGFVFVPTTMKQVVKMIQIAMSVSGTRSAEATDSVTQTLTTLEQEQRASNTTTHQTAPTAILDTVNGSVGLYYQMAA